MNILYITFSDILGQQFNGYLLRKELSDLGHRSDMAVHLCEERENPNIHQLGMRYTSRINNYLSIIEKKLSLRCVLPSLASTLYFKDFYKQADVIHLQLVHGTQFFSLTNVPIMSRQKPVIWTMHDPWLTTGHCVHSLDCERWKTGCGNCPYPNLNFPISKDRTHFNWEFKKYIMDHSKNVNIVVASQYMYDLMKKSPITSHYPISIIPFGIDTNVFKPMDPLQCREKLGIPSGYRVIGFRSAHDYLFKGVDYAEDALCKLSSKQPIWLLAIGAKGALKKITCKYPTTEIDWTNDTELIATALSASDIFLMPSIAEAFGLMAVEAMACGIPIITFEGTALPGVIHAPIGGITVPMKDSNAMAIAIEELLEDEVQRQKIAASALEIARREYTVELYVKRHLELYEKVIKSQ